MDSSLFGRKSLFSRKPRVTSVHVSNSCGKQFAYFEEVNYDEFMFIVERIQQILCRFKNCLIGIAIEKHDWANLAVVRGYFFKYWRH